MTYHFYGPYEPSKHGRFVFHCFTNTNFHAITIISRQQHGGAAG